MPLTRADLSRSCWSVGYLLDHCEGFRVESSEGRLGYVEEIVRAPEGGAPVALGVWITGRDAPDHAVVMIEDVLELHAEGERIVAREWKKSQARRRRSSPSTSTARSPERGRNASA